MKKTISTPQFEGWPYRITAYIPCKSLNEPVNLNDNSIDENSHTMQCSITMEPITLSHIEQGLVFANKHRSEKKIQLTLYLAKKESEALPTQLNLRDPYTRENLDRNNWFKVHIKNDGTLYLDVANTKEIHFTFEDFGNYIKGRDLPRLERLKLDIKVFALLGMSLLTLSLNEEKPGPLETLLLIAFSALGFFEKPIEVAYRRGLI